MIRTRKFNMFIGGRNVGKSTQIEKMILFRNKKYNEPVIILDPNGQAKWFPYPEISLEMYEGMKSGIYRIVTMEYQKFFHTTFNKKKKIQVVGEDSSNYFGPQVDKKIYPLIIGLRHPGHDIDFNAVSHAIKRTPKYVLEQINDLILFKTSDVWDDVKDRFDDEAPLPWSGKTPRQMVYEAFVRVNSHPDPYYFEIITLKKAEA